MITDLILFSCLTHAVGVGQNVPDLERYKDRKRFPIPVTIRRQTNKDEDPNATIDYDARGNPKVVVDAALVKASTPSFLDFVVLHESAHHLLWHYLYGGAKAQERWQHEYEADAVAQAVLLGWGRGKELPTVYRKLGTLPGSLDTHPPGDQRVQMLMYRQRPMDAFDSPSVRLATKSVQVPEPGRPPILTVVVSVRNTAGSATTLRVAGTSECFRNGKWNVIDTSFNRVRLLPKQEKQVSIRLAWPSSFGFKLRFGRPRLIREVKAEVPP